MLEILLRLEAEAGPAAIWLIVFFAAVVAVFVIFIGIAMQATLHAPDPWQQQVRYQVFRDLIDLFRNRGCK